MDPPVTEMFLVGGAVRDMHIGLSPKDLDFAVVAPSFNYMVDYLNELGVEPFLVKPEYGTIRGRFPKSSFEFAGFELAGQAVDFVLARRDGYYSDGRRPDGTFPGTLHDDLSRRDFTVNAMALADDGTLIDPFDGLKDLYAHRLNAVGYAPDRLREDALRVVRALRFEVTKGLHIQEELSFAMRTVATLNALRENIATDRIREELHRMLAHNTPHTLYLLVQRYPAIGDVIFKDHGIWLKPTTEKP